MSERRAPRASACAASSAAAGNPAHCASTVLAASSSAEERSSRSAARAVRTSPSRCHGRLGGSAMATGIPWARSTGANCATSSCETEGRK
eukprot:scaffold6013_cov210-Isochrysis_galbana.AAC.3